MNNDMNNNNNQIIYNGEEAHQGLHKDEEVFNTDDSSEEHKINSRSNYNHLNEDSRFAAFLQAIINENTHGMKTILDRNPEFANRLDLQTKQTPVFFAVQTPNQENAIEMLKILKEKGADLGYKDTLKQTIVYYLARDGRLKALDYTVSQGLNVVDNDIHTQNPLYYAAREGKVEMVGKLIDLGIDINHVDQYNQTCLFYAAKKGSLETCKYLIERGAKHDHADSKKQTALVYAKKSGNKELVDYLTSLKQGGVIKKQTSTGISNIPSNKPDKSAHSVSSTNEEKILGKRKREIQVPKAMYKLTFTDDNGQITELTEKDFDKFKNDYPDIASLILNPQKINNESGSGLVEIKERESWEKIAKKILNILWKMKGAFHFHAPVDPKKLNCPDYFDIVKNPMDFGTIKTRLNANIYKKCQDFENDMRLVFQNCILYNGTESEVGKIGVNLEREFDNLAHQYNLNIFINPPHPTQQQQQSQNKTSGDFTLSSPQQSYHNFQNQSNQYQDTQANNNNKLANNNKNGSQQNHHYDNNDDTRDQMLYEKQDRDNLAM